MRSEQRKFRKLVQELSPGTALPELNVVPAVDALKLPPGCQQLLRYVKAGPRMRHDKMAALVSQQFGKVWGRDIKSCRPLDRKLVQTLVREGYSEEAIVKWWFQPEHRHSVEHQEEYVRELVREEKERWAILAKQTEELRAVPQPLAEYLDHLVQGKQPVTDECRIHGDVLWLCPRTAYRLYARNMVAEGKTPLTEKEITVLFRNLHHMRAPYWLGKASDDSPYSCALSITRLKEHGYGPDLSLLTSAPPPSGTPSGSAKA